jgi:hypothetical protein
MGKREIQHINLVGGAPITAAKPKKRKMVSKAKSRKTSANIAKTRDTARASK